MLPTQQAQYGVDALDEDLLAALDDVLSFSDSTSIVDAFATPTGPLDAANATLGAEIDEILSIGIPPKLSHQSPLNRSNSGKTQPETPAIPGKKGKDARTAPYKPRRRKRPKDELDYLRAKVADMEDELTALKEKPEVGSPAAVNAAEIIFNGEQGTQSDMLLCWQKISERQKREADRSLVENLRLRAMLEGQLNVARSLEAAIDQHQQEAAQSLPTFGEGIPQPAVVSDEVIFAHLNQSLGAQYAELDSVLEISGIAHVNRDHNNGTKAHQDSSGVSVRHEEVRLLPFSMDAVHRAMWGILRYSTAKEMMLGPFQTHVIDDNHMNVTMIEKIQLGKERVTNIVRRFAFRRVFEQDRTVVVWTSYIEMDGSVFVRLREKGFVTTSPFDFGNSTSSSVGVPGSVTRMAVLATPELSAFLSAQDQKAHIGEMTELVVATYRVSMGLMHQIIDSLLLREAMGGKVLGGDEHEAVGSTQSTSPL
ncbi:hypothetical protein PRIC2_001722 [Phytophthora ramorum]